MSLLSRPVLARYSTHIATGVIERSRTRAKLRGLFIERAYGARNCLASQVLPHAFSLGVGLRRPHRVGPRLDRSHSSMKRAAEDLENDTDDGPVVEVEVGRPGLDVPRSPTLPNLPTSPTSGQQQNKQRKKAPPPPPSAIARSLASSTTDFTSQDIWQSGMLLVDKPKTWTSFDVCGKIRGELARAMQVKAKKIKVGHAGTLDPMATGLLIVCIGKGTKSIDTLMGMPKEYSGTMKLGEVTDSYDADGSVLSTLDWKDVTNERLEGLIKDQFLGTIQQVPPMYSALKQGGKKLCDLAREGKEVERKAREIVVERYDVSREDPGSQTVDYHVRCSKGTYIRCLAHDLGQAAGCGAHLVALRREKIGDFDVKDAWQVDDLVAFIKRFGRDE